MSIGWLTRKIASRVIGKYKKGKETSNSMGEMKKRRVKFGSNEKSFYLCGMKGVLPTR